MGLELDDKDLNSDDSEMERRNKTLIEVGNTTLR